MLVSQAGNEVLVTVRRQRRQAENGERRTLVDERPSRYRDWVDAEREKVHQATTAGSGTSTCPIWGRRYAEFHRAFLVEYDRDALIVDVRVNGGGHVSGLLLEKLARKRVGDDFPRWSSPKPYPGESPAGPWCA